MLKCNPKLTEREKEILRLLHLPLTFIDLSESLYISVSTLRSHVHNIYEKIGIKEEGIPKNFKRQKALDVARRKGLI